MGEEFYNVKLPVNGASSRLRFTLSTDSSDRIVREWEKRPAEIPQARKSRIYAEAAFLRYRSYVEMGQEAVEAFSEAARILQSDPEKEIQISMLGHIDSVGEATVCFALLRRTWFGNLVIDYLAASPDIVTKRVVCRGIGSATLRGALEVGRRMQCSLVWVETAADSCMFYQRNFGLAEGSDVIIVETEAAIQQVERSIKARQ